MPPVAPSPSLSLKGLFPPLTTPFADNGDLDLSALKANIEKLNHEPLRGYVIGGSNGEFTSLSWDERLEVVRAAREVIPRDRLLIAGSGMESTRATIELTRRMADLGADAAIVVTPSYFKARMTAPALERHFTEVADTSPIPVVLYNVPANTGLDLPAAVAVKLSAHPRVIGLKDSGGDITKIGLMLHDASAGFQILAGSASFLLAAAVLGAVGAVAALANLAPRRLAQMLAALDSGDLAAARAIQLRLIEVNTAVTSRFGVPGLKAALDMLGYLGGRARLPLLPLPDEDRATLRTILVRAGLLDPA